MKPKKITSTEPTKPPFYGLSLLSSTEQKAVENYDKQIKLINQNN